MIITMVAKLNRFSVYILWFILMVCFIMLISARGSEGHQEGPANGSEEHEDWRADRIHKGRRKAMSKA